MIRFLAALAVRAGLLLVVLAAVYAAADALPGDPVRLAMGPTASPADVEARRESLGLDRPLPARFADWLSGLVQGDLGTTVRGQPINDLLGDRLASTLLLTGLTFAFVLVVALAWAALWSARPRGRFGRTSAVGTSILVATPEFVLGTLLVLVFALVLGLLPATTVVGADGRLATPLMLVLPVLALGLPHAAWQTRVNRAAIAEAAAMPHVEQARLDGVPERRVVTRHVLPLAAPTIAASLATMVGTLLAGAVVVETLFNYPGAGQLVAGSLESRDTTLLVSLTALCGLVVVAALVIADAIRLWALRGRR
ncbi:ABC transporter permease [Glycomyces algeriensis]|uniref:Metal transporter n=1 Tax=Glycomyces algeriensis TaxID=256037 RepID=A0A9W6GA86_9ACTN|nr:ABC transporter permease [Glycomyces algeriensis]MDA1364305.1 ABC transporter permease [Glycomyces algeriensis]MDR7350337.1 peptide/nickel transport system permease protein [Glycomyces algeriensis]GLI43043.1 metal transporter [Glycomyces algeriensis]